jgi:tetratricopeptide (TPR) repeat protein
MELEALTHNLAALAFGTTPLAQGLAAARNVFDSVSDSRELQGWVLRFIGTFHALDGRVAEGRELLEEARAIFTELGDSEALMALAFSTGPLEVRAGDHVAAEREYRHALELSQRMGDHGRMSNLASGLADVLLDEGRVDEAAEVLEVARSSAIKDDASAQGTWRMAAARLSMHRGETVEAVRLARESITMMESLQELLTLPDLLIRQAEVFRSANLDREARAALERAVDLSRLKGASAELQRAESILAALEPA